MNKKSIWLWIVVVFTVVIALGAWFLASRIAPVSQGQPEVFDIIDKDKNVVGQYTVPQDTDISKEPDADLILYGKRLHTETRRLLPDNVGSHMNCNSCHIAGGKANLGAPYINTYNSYPKFMARPGREFNLIERINGCFQRSMNGKPLPVDSREMKAMIAYMKWVGQGVPKDQRVKIKNAGKIDQSLVPNVERGKELYAVQCASCHGIDGAGLEDERGNIIFPPLWGDTSFNIGAGMARLYKAASFIKYNMPMGVQHHGTWGQGGVLSDQDAVDIAQYFTHQPRPDFPDKIHDFPSGKKPKDSRY